MCLIGKMKMTYCHQKLLLVKFYRKIILITALDVRVDNHISRLNSQSNNRILLIKPSTLGDNKILLVHFLVDEVVKDHLQMFDISQSHQMLLSLSVECPKVRPRQMIWLIGPSLPRIKQNYSKAARKMTQMSFQIQRRLSLLAIWGQIFQFQKDHRQQIFLKRFIRRTLFARLCPNVREI